MSPTFRVLKKMLCAGKKKKKKSGLLLKVQRCRRQSLGISSTSLSTFYSTSLPPLLLSFVHLPCKAVMDGVEQRRTAPQTRLPFKVLSCSDSQISFHPPSPSTPPTCFNQSAESDIVASQFHPHPLSESPPPPPKFFYTGRGVVLRNEYETLKRIISPCHLARFNTPLLKVYDLEMNQEVITVQTWDS